MIACLDRLRIRDALARSGWTALFAALTTVVTRAETADMELLSFAGRVVSKATVEGVDIGARTALFASSTALFLLLFVSTLALLQVSRRVLAEGTLELLEALSIGGLALWMARAYTLAVQPLIQLAAALQIAALALGLLDRCILRRGEHPERAAYFTTLGVLAYGLVYTYADWLRAPLRYATPWLNWYVGCIVIALHVLVRASCWRSDPARRSAACVHLATGLTVAAWLPLASVLREELYLTLNNRGVLDVGPYQVHTTLLAALGVWAAARIWRSARAGAPANLGGSVLRAGLPVFAFGLAVCGRYEPIIPASADMFEPGNPGLQVQQWFDFGRWPYIETFNAHGFSDSLWGFLYCFVQGFQSRTFGFYDFLDQALATLLIYFALRRATGNGYLAFFCAALLPFRPALFPYYSALALASVFVLDWLLARASTLRWTLFGFYCVAALLWRLDLGFANLVASAATMAVIWCVRAGLRPRPRDIALGLALCTVVCAGTYFALALARGVDPWQRLVDLRHIVDSGQATGYVTIADSFSPSVFWHLGAFPIGVLAVLGCALWSLRADATILRPSFLVLLLLYGGTYYFANYPRGLVRHSFREFGNVYLLSFGFVALSLAPYLWSRLTSPKAAAGVFLGLTCLLGGSFGLLGPLPEHSARFTNVWQQAADRRVLQTPLGFESQRIDRSPMAPEQVARQYRAICDFVAEMLGPEQTFLDLTNSPVLYVETHRLSPHYVNHLLIAQDEHLQRSELAEFGRHDIPFVLAWQEKDLAARDGVNANLFNTADGVANNVGQYLFHEWLHTRYEPWCIAGRWQVWRRKDWLAPAGPAPEDARDLAVHRGAPAEDGRVVLTPPATGADPDPDPQPASPRQAFLRLDGRAARDGELRVRIEVAGEDPGAAAVERDLALPAGDGPWFWTLPAELLGRPVASVELDFGRAPQLALSAAALLDAAAPAYTMIGARLHPLRSHFLGRVPWLWAKADDGRVLEQPALRTLHDLGVSELVALQIDPRTGPLFDSGVHRRKAGVLLAEAPAAHELRVGDHLCFDGAGERVVQSIEGLRVFVSGPRLDPLDDGSPHEVRVIPMLAEPARFRFEPLEDPARPCYVALRLGQAAADGQRAVLTWGQDDRALGHFEFDVLGDGRQDYLLRISSQSSWALTRCNWLEFERLDSDAVLLSLRLLDGD